MAIQNAINNRSSELTIDPGSSGDSFVQFDINATGEFRIGVDDTNDSFRISQGSALGTNDAFIITSAGEITKPLQPAFLAIITSQINDVTGDGTSYTIIWDTAIYDQTSDFNTSTGVFTAPITGKYQLETQITLGDLAATHNGGQCNITTSNRTYLTQQDVGASRDSLSLRYALCISALADMDAADTTHVVASISGGTKTVDIDTNAPSQGVSYFSGNLEV